MQPQRFLANVRHTDADEYIFIFPHQTVPLRWCIWITCNVFLILPILKLFLFTYLFELKSAWALPAVRIYWNLINVVLDPIKNIIISIKTYMERSLDQISKCRVYHRSNIVWCFFKRVINFFIICKRKDKVKVYKFYESYCLTLYRILLDATLLKKDACLQIKLFYCVIIWYKSKEDINNSF